MPLGQTVIGQTVKSQARMTKLGSSSEFFNAEQRFFNSRGILTASPPDQTRGLERNLRLPAFFS
jgi:hypothetical protein